MSIAGKLLASSSLHKAPLVMKHAKIFGSGAKIMLSHKMVNNPWLGTPDQGRRSADLRWMAPDLAIFEDVLLNLSTILAWTGGIQRIFPVVQAKTASGKARHPSGKRKRWMGKRKRRVGGQRWRCPSEMRRHLAPETSPELKERR